MRYILLLMICGFIAATGFNPSAAQGPEPITDMKKYKMPMRAIPSLVRSTARNYLNRSVSQIGPQAFKFTPPYGQNVPQRFVWR